MPRRPRSTAASTGAPPPRSPTDGSARPAAGTGHDPPEEVHARGTRARWARRAAAVRRWWPNSAVGHLWGRLQVLDFVNRGMLFAAVLLLSFVPFMITLQALVGRSAATTVIRRFGLDQQAADDVGRVFTSPANAEHAITGLSWLFFVLAGVAAAAALQELYEHAFDLPHLGRRNTPRQVAWLAALIAMVALANWTAPWLHRVGGVLLDGVVALVSGTVFFWFTMWLLLAGRRGWRRLLPSAVATAVCWVGLTVGFRLTLSGDVTSDYAKYGPIGVVFAVMSVLIAVGVVIILGALAGVVWEERRAARAQPSPSAESAAPDGDVTG